MVLPVNLFQIKSNSNNFKNVTYMIDYFNIFINKLKRNYKTFSYLLYIYVLDILID